MCIEVKLHVWWSEDHCQNLVHWSHFYVGGRDYIQLFRVASFQHFTHCLAGYLCHKINCMNINVIAPINHLGLDIFINISNFYCYAFTFYFKMIIKFLFPKNNYCSYFSFSFIMLHWFPLTIWFLPVISTSSWKCLLLIGHSKKTALSVILTLKLYHHNHSKNM